MDIEEYLRQKRELEAKKEMLETKEKVDQDKERLKREQRAKIYAEHGVTPRHQAPEHHVGHDDLHHYRVPSAGPGMWNTILLFLILVLLAVSYFMPRFGEDQIRTIAKQETGDKKIVEEEQQVEEQQQEEQQQEEEEQQQKELPEGPLFTFFAKDDEEGLFDDEGKLDGELLVVNIEKGLQYYDDFTIQLNNKEAEPILCKIDRDVQIDTNFDGKNDLKDIDLDRFKVEIDPKGSEIITSDVVPGTIETGTYEGKGDIQTTYDARCYFCLDEDCNKVDEKAESTGSTFFRVWINKELDTGNTTNTTTNRSR
ncbi:hypothetical protein HYS50_01875 [Candidatus Woesearchaeota archaeon]|nr:hypothetical protein [Candidatus Woesearchaeota archaeon]